MTRIHDDPVSFSEDALRGFADLHADTVSAVPGGVVRTVAGPPGKVAVVLGGGAGHYPAFAGLVGPGLADGAVVGNVFTSPSAAQAYSVARAADNGGGVVFAYGNYQGDVINFDLAARRLQEEGVQTRHLVVTDDIASAPPNTRDQRRGIAGGFTVFRVLAGAAEAGLPLAETERAGRAANTATRTIGVAFAGCTIPGAERPLFDLPGRGMGLGLGIHGEPGLSEGPLPPARDLAADLVARVLAEAPEGASDRVAVVLNGLGATKYEELFLLWGHVAPLLRRSGLTLVEPEVGELVTSLDMAGTSLSVTWLDPELESYWTAPARTPAYTKGAARGREASTGPAPGPNGPHRSEPAGPAADPIPQGDTPSREWAALATAALRAVHARIAEGESELGRLDSVAGDGDHGRGMVRGVSAALAAAERAVENHAGAATTLGLAADAWADQAGGTSGVLWGAGLRAFGAHLGDTGVPSEDDLVAAAGRFLDAVTQLGGAEAGDKTFVDAVIPFVATLREAREQNRPLAQAWPEAAAAAERAAAETAGLRPRRGRARPLAERSLGTPDPGAVSFAWTVTAARSILVKEGEK
ncbi:dihydroxyacetone kinase family protein [Nocardiopsis sp. NPDC006938]|uniref:dihydroxyacetone kinase family protein n=1 Tax=Nocardiopsis sp. NPDC006938 TaxID=3364337 RepID=UPI0036AB3A1B